MELAQGVQGEIQRQLGYLSRREIMEQSLENFGCAIVCPDLETCARLADQVAPEHMEIVTADPGLTTCCPPAAPPGFSPPCRWTPS